MKTVSRCGNRLHENCTFSRKNESSGVSLRSWHLAAISKLTLKRQAKDQMLLAFLQVLYTVFWWRVDLLHLCATKGWHTFGFPQRSHFKSDWHIDGFILPETSGLTTRPTRPCHKVSHLHGPPPKISANQIGSDVSKIFPVLCIICIRLSFRDCTAEYGFIF